MHAQSGAFLGAETVRQLQQGLGHAAGDVREDQVRQGIIGAAQAASQHAQQLLGDLRVLADPVVQHGGVHRRRVQLRHADGGRGARTRVEDGQLAEHVGGAHDGQQVLAPIHRVAGELHLAADDDVQPVTRFALVEDGGATRQIDGIQLLDEGADCGGFNTLEDACPR